MKKSSLLKSIFVSLTAIAFFAGCVSSQIAEQRKQRDRLSQQTGFYCEFINGEAVAAIDLELNLQMAKKCDGSEHFTVSSYIMPNEQRGVIYCCILPIEKARKSKSEVKEENKPAEPAKQ